MFFLIYKNHCILKPVVVYNYMEAMKNTEFKSLEWTREEAINMLMYEIKKGEESGGEQSFNDFWQEFCKKNGITQEETDDEDCN